MLGALGWKELVLTWFPALREAIGSLQDAHSYTLLALPEARQIWLQLKALGMLMDITAWTQKESQLPSHSS